MSVSIYDLLEAIGETDASLVEDAKTRKRPRRVRWERLLPIAACVALVITCVGVPLLLRWGGPGADWTPPEGIVTWTPDTPWGVSVKSVREKDVFCTKHHTEYNPGNDLTPLRVPWDQRCLILTAKAVGEVSPPYADVTSEHSPYRILKMVVLDPMDSGIEGSFYYLAMRAGDDLLSESDAVILMLSPSTISLMLDTGTGDLVRLTDCYTALSGYCLSALPFTDGVLDDAVLQKRVPEENLGELAYMNAALDRVENDHENHKNDPESSEADCALCRRHAEKYEEYERWFVVRRNSTYEETVEKIRKLRQELIDTTTDQAVLDRLLAPWQPLLSRFQSAEALAALAYISNFDNGVFVVSEGSNYIFAQRYIGGVPTNEIIKLKLSSNGTEKVTYEGLPFTPEERTGLPNLTDYLAQLDLSSLTPPHIKDIPGLACTGIYARAFYEKTDHGVESMIRVSWTCETRYDCGCNKGHYEDDLYIRLTTGKPELLTQEEVKAYIGESDWISGKPGLCWMEYPPYLSAEEIKIPMPLPETQEVTGEDITLLSFQNPMIQSRRWDIRFGVLPSPVVLIDSREKLEEIFPYMYVYYNDAFFEDHVLLLCSRTDSSSIKVSELSAIYLKNGKLYPVWKTNRPEEIASDLVYAIVSAEIPRSELGDLDLTDVGGQVEYLHEYIEAQK